MKRRILVAFLAAVFLFAGAGLAEGVVRSEGGQWIMGFGSAEIPLPEDSDEPLYIAGYHNGWEISGVLDLQRANAVWMDAGSGGMLLIGVDCVGLGGNVVDQLRERLSDFRKKTGCLSVNIFSTHTHAGLDTLGLWGPYGIDGKNGAFMENLCDAVVNAAEAAYGNRAAGKLFYGEKKTKNTLRDSRNPQVYDPNLYQLRFVPQDGTGFRMLFYAAHAESLRGDNRMLSRDFPGVITDIIKEETGEDVLFLPGAIGGLIMTKELGSGVFKAEQNLRMTGERLAKYALTISESDQREIPPRFALSSVRVELPLDNPVFLLYQFLGILDNPIFRGESETGFWTSVPLGVLQMDGLTVALLPCELFPELLTGEGLAETDPAPLEAIAAEHGAGKLLAVGLCNDEIGYVPPPSAYLLNEKLPFFDRITDQTGEDHYEETNSLGIHTAQRISDGFREALEALEQ